jgi:hypothetical protein
MRLTVLLLAIGTALGQPTPPPDEDLARVEAEPNLEKRAHAALDNAVEALRQARDAYAKGDDAGTNARLEEVQRSVELAASALEQTGKNPSRSPKHFKQAELRTRDLLRKLDGFRDQMSVADRAAAERVVEAVQKIHDAWLDGIMGKKK